MQPHHKITLSYLWHLFNQLFNFFQCECKHSDDQSIVEDENTSIVVLKKAESILEFLDEHGDVHADDGK
jgi:hypothetical protein